MTAIVLTLTAGFALLSTDSLCYDVHGQVRPISKRTLLSGSRGVLSGSGSAGALVAWGNTLNAWYPEANIREIIELAPAGLAALWRGVPETWRAHGLRIVLAGWADDGPVGAVHQYPDFEAQHLEIGRGHCLQPEVSPHAPEYAKLSEAWGPAAAGKEVEKFHVAVLENQCWAAANGHAEALEPGSVIGGAIQSTRIDAQGVHTRFLGELPP